MMGARGGVACRFASLGGAACRFASLGVDAADDARRFSRDGDLDAVSDGAAPDVAEVVAFVAAAHFPRADLNRIGAFANSAFSRRVMVLGDTTAAVDSGPHVARKTTRPSSRRTSRGAGSSPTPPWPSAPLRPRPHVYSPAPSSAVAAACKSPLARWRILVGNATRAGTVDSAPPAFPTDPHTHTPPLASSASVCHCPHDTLRKFTSPSGGRAAIVGVSVDAAPSPRPSFPPSASPHVHKSPAGSVPTASVADAVAVASLEASAMAAVCHTPHDTESALRPVNPATRRGVGVDARLASAPCPSAPNAPSPHVHTPPSSATAAA